MGRRHHPPKRAPQRAGTREPADAEDATADADEPAANPLPAPFFHRIVAAMFLRLRVYEDIARDHYATGQAAVVVCLAGLAQPLPLISLFGSWGWPFLMLFRVVVWLAFGAAAYLTVRTFLATPVTFKTCLRVLGYSDAPGIFNWVVYEVASPLREGLRIGLWLWLFAAAVVGMRAAVSGTALRAVAVTLPPFLVRLVSEFAIFFVLQRLFERLLRTVEGG